MEPDNREIFAALLRLLERLTAVDIERAISAAGLRSGRPHPLYIHSQQGAKDDALNALRVMWDKEETSNVRKKARESLIAIAKQRVKDDGEEQLQAVLRENRLQFIDNQFVRLGVETEEGTEPQEPSSGDLESTPDAARLKLRTAPPTARVKQVSTGQVSTGLDSRIVGHSGVFDPITVETAEDIDRATRKRFSEAPAAVVADAKRAKDITIALQVALRDLHLNVPEAGEALDLLDKQADELDNIIAILQSDGDKEAARKTLRDLLYDVLESFLKVLAKSGPTRGILAAAALASLSLTGVEVTYIVAALVAGPIVGLEVNAIRKILAGWKKKKDEGE